MEGEKNKRTYILSVQSINFLFQMRYVLRGFLCPFAGRVHRESKIVVDNDQPV